MLHNVHDPLRRVGVPHSERKSVGGRNRLVTVSVTPDHQSRRKFPLGLLYTCVSSSSKTVEIDTVSKRSPVQGK